MVELAQVVRREVEKYAASSLNSRSYAALDDQRQVYIAMSVIDISNPDRASPIVMARVDNNYVIIGTDWTNKPLVDALVQAGIPRSQIILAYEGEKFPDSEDVAL